MELPLPLDGLAKMTKSRKGNAFAICASVLLYASTQGFLGWPESCKMLVILTIGYLLSQGLADAGQIFHAKPHSATDRPAPDSAGTLPP